MTSSAAFFEISLLKVCWFVCLFNSGSQGVWLELSASDNQQYIKREPGKYLTLINFADKISSTNLKVVDSTCGGRLCIVLLLYMFQ